MALSTRQYYSQRHTTYFGSFFIWEFRVGTSLFDIFSQLCTQLLAARIAAGGTIEDSGLSGFGSSFLVAGLKYCSNAKCRHTDVFLIDSSKQCYNLIIHRFNFYTCLSTAKTTKISPPQIISAIWYSVFTCLNLCNSFCHYHPSLAYTPRRKKKEVRR